MICIVHSHITQIINIFMAVDMMSDESFCIHAYMNLNAPTKHVIRIIILTRLQKNMIECERDSLCLSSFWMSEVAFFFFFFATKSILNGNACKLNSCDESKMSRQMFLLLFNVCSLNNLSYSKKVRSRKQPRYWSHVKRATAIFSYFQHHFWAEVRNQETKKITHPNLKLTLEIVLKTKHYNNFRNVLWQKKKTKIHVKF